ncbi:MAG: FMN-binding protein [Deltaproteobacteria bacterium]|nr:FMN-binding protein [Deltaproteobacteria bacterium]
MGSVDQRHVSHVLAHSRIIIIITTVMIIGLGSTGAATASPKVTVRGLLASQFRSSKSVGYVKLNLTPQEIATTEAALHQALPKNEYTIYVARTEDHVDGFAVFDDEKGQHEPITLATFFDAQGNVSNVEIVAYREPYGDGVRDERFRKQFQGMSETSDFTPGTSVDVISGATISTHSVCRAVHRATVLVKTLRMREAESSSRERPS